MKNPLADSYTEADDLQLVTQTPDGDRTALDAWDLTQEVLVKEIIKLSQFRGKSAFRTWLYRIVFNEFLQAKRRKGEAQFGSFQE